MCLIEYMSKKNQSHLFTIVKNATHFNNSKSVAYIKILNNSDTQSQSLTISSEIDQLDQESENNQLELEHNQLLQSHKTNHQIKIIDLPNKDKHEVLAEMNKWEHAVRNNTCDELINSFGYIFNQNGYVRNLDDKVYFSNNDLRMDKQYANIKRDYTIINDSNIKYESYIRVLNEMKSFYRFSVDEALNQINSHLETNKNLLIQYRQNIEVYKKDLLSEGGKNKNESYKKYKQGEVFEETQIKIYELEFITLHEGFRLFPDEKECIFKCALYFAIIGNQVPKQTETCNNDAWFAVNLKDFGKYDLTDLL
ncbi:hypothetical protein F8M41_005241 [Gigaspora margarita]|uniref:Uncharacterized protein n=1 Tax=Gigaspora margarita TaxID=4874 RepID=A0A8H4A4S5_GIGMA|nr:hypothetical protein F8M41_005241 [Gigaspora margarita]